MHELGITENIMDIALDKAKEAQASKISRINLVVGELSGFVSDCIEFYFEFLSKDTIAQGAKLCLYNFVAGVAQWLFILKIRYGPALNVKARAWK